MSKDNLPKAQSGKVVTGSPGQLSSPNPLIDEQFMQDRYGGYRSPAVDGSPLPSVAYTNPYNTGTDDSKNSSALANLLKFANTERDPGKGGKLRTLDEYAGNEKGRYDFFMPGDFDNEDAVAQNQSFGSKMVNGVGKGLLLTGTTFLQSTVGLVNGAAKAIADGKFSSFYDNEFNRALDEINKKAEDALPNYYTAAERDASWYSPKYWATGNFMWDGVVKNLGFAAGAALSGGAYTKALSSLPYASRLFSVGKSAETLAATEAALAGASKVTDTYGKILNLSNKFASSYSYLNKGGRVVVAGLATTGEAGIEALHSSNEFRKELIDAHVAEFGIEPTGLALKEIDDATEGSGNATFFANMGLLTATNYIQFPKILGSTYSGEKSIVTGLVREIDDIVLEGGKYALPKAKYPFLSKLNKIRPYTFSTSEAFEEVSQYTATVATQDYYKKALNGEATSWMNSIGVGITEGAFSDEGAKNALIGGISGTLMLSKGRYQKNKAREMSTAAALKEFNNVKLSDFTKETIDAVNRGTVIQKEREQEIKDGNIIGSKNLEADYIINYLTPRIKYGRYDLIKSDINEYKNLASTEEGFAQLQSEGKALESDTREAYVERLNRFEQTAEDVKSLYQSLNLRYGSEIKKDKDGNPIIEDGKKFLKYGPDVMNQMIYAASKVSDLDKRIVDLMAPLTAAGINTSEVLNQLAQGDPSAFNEAVNNISQMDILDEDKETFGKALDDIAELSLSRQSFLKAYQDIKDNPDKFILYRPEDATNASGPVETVSVKTKQGQRDIELNTEYFAGKGADYSKQPLNSTVPISRFSILGVDKDGKLKIKNLDTGKESEISTEEFANLNVGKVSTLQANRTANYYYNNRNEIFKYNFGKPFGGERPGRLEYQNDKLYFVYLTPKGKVTKKELNRTHFVAQKDFNQARIVKVGSVENENQKSAKELFLSTEELAKEKLTLKKNREARLETLAQLGEEAKENLDEANDTISKSKEKLAKVREDLSNIQKMKETGGKIKLNFSKATKSFTKAINNLTSMQAELTEMINNAELEKDELEFNISYFQDFANEIDDLPENSGEFLKELKDQVALLVDNSRNLNNAIKAAKKLSSSADKTVKSAVKLLRSAIKSTYIVDQDYSQYLDELLDEAATGENIETVWPLLKQELANFTLTNDLAKDTNINENGLLEATKNLRQLQSDLTDLEAELNARNIIVNRFQSIIDDYNAQKAQEVAQQENLNKIMSTADKGIPTYSTDDVYEPQPKKMVNVLPRTTLGIDSDSDYFKGEEIKEHQVRANQFGLDLESFNNRDKIRGVYVTSKTQNQLLPGVTEKMLDNDQSLIDQFKDSIIVMVMVDETGLPVGVDGKPIPEGASLLENAIFQSIAEEGFSNGTMFRDGTPQETKDFINAEYKKFRDGILAQETLGVPVNVSASFGIPQFELDSKGNKIYTTTTSVKDAGLITDSDLESSLLLDVPTTNKTNSKGTTQYTSALGSVFLELKNGLVRLKNRKHTAKDASAIYDSILQLSKNLLSAEGINSTSSSRILDFLRGVTYWGIPANEAGNNSVFFEKNKDGKLMLRLSNNGVTFMFTPSALERNKDQIVKTLEDMFNNVNRSKTQDINQKFEQIISISPEGDIESVVWPNYQSYLLSSKGRRDFELPLHTLMKPKVEGESNRKGVYFINNDTADNFEIPEPSSQATNIPIRRSETYVIDGNTVNTYTSPNTGKKILFKIKLVDDSIVKNGIEILPGGNLSEFRAKNITDDQLKAVIIDSIKPGMIKKTAQEAYKKQVDPVTPAPAQQTSEVKTIKRNLVDLETPITEFEPVVQKLFNSPNPTVKLYENIVANYEYDLEAELSPSLRKSIEAMLRDVKKSFTISQPTQQTSEVKSIPMQPDNVSKILSGEKTTTLRTNNLPSGVYNIGGQQFNLTNRGLLSIEEAGGVEAISKSEVFAKSGPKFSTTKNFLAGKSKLYVYDILPTQQTSKVSLNKQSSLSTIVSSWLQTEEGSLDNQTAEESASKFALIYNRKNPVTGEDNRSVAEIIEGNKSLTPGQRKDNAGQVGTDLFNTIAQGLSVRETILNEIENQTLSLKPARPTSELDSLNDLINKRISDVNSVELGGLIKEKMNVNLDRFDSSDVQDLLLKGLSKKEIEEILIKKCKD